MNTIEDQFVEFQALLQILDEFGGFTVAIGPMVGVLPCFAHRFQFHGMLPYQIRYMYLFCYKA